MTAPRLRTTLRLYFAAFLASGAAGCSRAAPARAAAAAADRATFRGVYEVGADRSAFLPCGSTEQWYVSQLGAPARDLRRLTSTKDLQPPGGGMFPPELAPSIRRAYAEVQGDTVAVNPGRLAIAYERELRVTRVLIVRPAQGGVCPRGITRR
jgi:hypothetical protein